jgi:hypothetical protein
VSSDCDSQDFKIHFQVMEGFYFFSINITRIRSNNTPFDSSLNVLSKVILLQVDLSSRSVAKSRKAVGAKRWR